MSWHRVWIYWVNRYEVCASLSCVLVPFGLRFGDYLSHASALAVSFASCDVA
jgi:hypothetical protein